VASDPVVHTISGDRVRASGGRLINTSSQVISNRKSLDLDDLDFAGIGGEAYEAYEAYSRSKIAFALLTRGFARRYPDVRVADFHPGVFVAGLAREMPVARFVARSPLRRAVSHIVGTPESGALELVELARTDAPLSGEYYLDGRPADPGAAVRDPAAAARLWDLASARVGLPA